MDAEARHQHLCQSYRAEQAHAGDGKQRALVPRFRTLHFAYRYRHSRRKREDAKNEVIAEMRGKFEQLGLSFEEVMGLDSGRIGRRNRGTQLPSRYISPNGETWSGRGYPPKWIRDLEEEGRDREDYRIQEEDAGNR